MNSTTKLTEESKLSKTPNGRSERNPKVDIKGICKKFENLSSSSENNINITETTPIAPIRRKRCSYNVNNKNSVRASNDFTIQTSPVNNFAVKTLNETPTSVKEKTKLFESPVLADRPVSCVSAKLKRNNDTCLATQRKNSQNSQSNHVEKSDPVSVSSPPAKPPRSYLHSDLNAEITPKDSFGMHRENSMSEIKEKSIIKTRNTSFSFETNTEEPIHKSSRLGSAPEIMCANTSKALQTTPKAIKSSGKTQAFLNCLKNISTTANNICEKVKQKHSSIFVDLTPTTVSPPKHYGTLKRSMSEEHIYAEPAAVLQTNSSESRSPAAEPLHYMCTSIIPPSVPHREINEENTNKSCTSNLSVRNMIYGSFAGLRDVPKENSENASNNTATDSTEADLSTKAIQDRIIYVKSVRKQISSSSLCLSPKLYEALFIVNIVENQPQVAYSFPLKVDAEYNIPLLPHICFPHSSLWKSVSVYQSEVFHFSLIDENVSIFGYCLRIQGWPESGSGNEHLCVKLPVAICLLSSFSAPVFYRKLLFEIEKHLTLPRNSCFKYIRSLRKLGVPNAGASLSIPDCSEEDTKRIVITRPLDSHFVGLEMTRALQLLDIDILVKCVASLLLERRILFFSSSVSNLYHCCKSISSLLYPFEWPHQVVPVLPACLTIHCCSDQPYILGIVNNNCDSVLELLAEHELLIIDVDKGIIIKSCNDEDTILPRRVQKAVISALNLAKNMTDPTEMMRDIMISEAFVHMSVEMIGHYENHFAEVNGNMTFQKENFLKNAFSYNIRSFLQWFTETQMFDSFIEDSLWRMKYRNICQTSMRTFFEKRVDEYKWELAHDNEKLSRFIGKTVRNFGEILKGFKK